ncbi:MAG: hypothetical protein DMD96_02035, partial [Candidatus Rokuibacteriota bacterium]
MILAVLCALLLWFIPLAASAQSATSSLLVKLAAGLSPEQQAEVIARNGGLEISSIPALRLHVIQVAPADLPQVLPRYQADPQVVHAEENKTRQSQAFPADPLYPNQWSLPKIGWDLVFGNVTPTGSAIVAVLDTGVDAQHPDLAGNVIPGTSILDGSSGTTDPSGHGTWVAGIAAAQTNTLEGIAGVAYAGVRIMPVTVLDANGLGQDSDVIAGVVWAADHGADVIVMAFSNPGFSQNLQDALDYAWSKNVVLVAATGNDALNTPTFPAGDRGVMGVAGTDPNDTLVPFSNHGQGVFIAAPATDIQTTEIGDAYSVINGTSAAAAIVAGAAAFMKAVDPTLTNGIIVGRLARMADPAGTQDQTGNGRINMARAMADTGTDFIQPAGAPPVGDGGPFVGPYRAAATNINTATTLNAIASPLSSGQTSVSFSGRVDSVPSGTPPPAGSQVDLEFRTFIAACNGSFATTASALTDASGNFSGTFTAQTTFASYSYRADFLQVNVGGGGGTTWQKSTSACRTVDVGPSVTFNATNLGSDVAASTAVLSVTIGAGSPMTVTKGDLPKSFAAVSGTTISYSYNSPIASTSATKQYRWSTTAGTGSASGQTAQSGSFSASANSSVIADYKTQFQLTFAQSGIGGDSTGTVVTVAGSGKTAAVLPFSAFFDSGATVTYAYTDPVPSTVTGKRYTLTTPAASPASPITVSGAATITGTYKVQFQLTFAQSGIGGDSTGTVVTVVGSAKTAAVLPFSDWFDSGSSVTYSYSDPVASTVTGKR